MSRHRHVLILFEGAPYPMDTRLQDQVSTLMEAGYEVTVISPAGRGYDKLDETTGGVRVRRFKPSPDARGAFGYLREYGVALVRMAQLARRVHRERPVDIVFISNPPDLLVMSALPLIRRGARVVFDARELSPELFEAKFHRRGLLHRLLVMAERFAIRRTDVVVAVSEPFIDVLHTRVGIPRDRTFLVTNAPDPRRIYPVEPRPDLRRGRDHLVLWLGVMSQQEGLGRLIEAADELVHGAGRDDITFALVGPGDVHDQLRADVRGRHLEDAVFVLDGVNDDMVRAYLSTADICVNVDESVGMNDLTVMRKVVEYMAAGRAVVQFPLKEMSRICGDTAVYARNGDAHDLAQKIQDVMDDPERRRRLGEAARARAYDGLMWPQQAPVLLEALSTALDRTMPDPRGQQERIDRHFGSLSAHWRDLYRVSTLEGVIHQQRLALALAWIDELGVRDGARALDIGCGAGVVAIPLARRGYDVRCIDSSPPMVELARAEVELAEVSDSVAVATGDAHSLDLDDESCDLVVALGVVPFLHSPLKAAKEMARVLKPGGHAILSSDNRFRINLVLDPRHSPLVPGRNALKSLLYRLRRKPRDEFEWNLFTRPQVEALLGRAGLQVVGRATLGYGPFTFLGKPVFSEERTIAIHLRLQGLADRRSRRLRAVAAQHLILARKIQRDHASH